MQEYSTTDRQVHWLSQIIAKVSKALVPEKGDDSHTNLYFDAKSKRLMGRWIDTPEGKMLLALNLTSQSFEWLNSRLHRQANIIYINKELQTLEQEISVFPKSLGVDIKKINNPLHFEIPDYKIRAIKGGELLQGEIEVWGRIRDLANNASLAISGYLQVDSEIRIWPHHFDTGIYSQVTESLGIGFGLAMEDSMIGDAYFYISCYSPETPIKYKNLPSLDVGKWVTGKDWNGAVLPYSEFKDLSADLALEKVKTFSKQSVDWFLNL